MNKRKFVIGNLLQKVTTKKIKLKKGDCPTSPSNEYNIPARTATTTNQGLSCYVPEKEATVLKDKISVSANGDFCAFWHDEKFTILQDAYALEGKGFILNREIALYIISAMYTVLAPKYNWNNKSGWEKIKTEFIAIPVITDENGNPILDADYKYHEEGFVPDFDYMQERIEELEQERIEELEQERIEELEQYLVATGLNDYELTDEDIKTLSLSGFGYYEERDSENAIKVCKEFKVSDLFKLQKVSNKLAKEDLSDKYEYPAYSSDTSNNGIIGYTNNPEFICDDKTPVYITFGDHTRTLNIARKSFSVLDNVKVLIPCYNNNEVLLYITSVWQKQIPNLGYSRHWKVAKNCIISLSIQTDVSNNPIIDTECKYHPDGYIPDWDFMEKYIRAIEKIVIADVVKYKDAMISKTKEVVS